MVNYDALPLFPLNIVLYPDIPLPLYIFEPRYREMIQRCREENSPFGVVLIHENKSSEEQPMVSVIGTTARLTQYEELPDGCMNIVVLGETRFRVVDAFNDKPYPTARVEPFWEKNADPLQLKAPFDVTSDLFKTYLNTLFAQTNRTISALQLPQEPEFLSYAVANILQIPLHEKQQLLEITTTEDRLNQEIEILGREIEVKKSKRSSKSKIMPVDVQELSKLSSLN
jgi:Lon protease-like protein